MPDIEFTPHIVRHITSIQVRNLTPFPVRDSFTNALHQPAEQSSLTTYGSHVDDLDVSVVRKRTRRLSAASVATQRSLKSDDAAASDLPERAGRKHTFSRVSFTSGESSRNYSSSAAPTTTRPFRHRTASTNSSLDRLHVSTAPATTHSFPRPTGIFPSLTDRSQAALTKVIHTRLVESFIALYIPPAESAEPPSPSPPRSPVVSPTRKSARGSVSRPRHDRSSPMRLPNPFSPKAHVKSPSVAHSSLASPARSRSTQNRNTSPNVRQVSPQRQSSPSRSTLAYPVYPNYLSPVHRPSTNPYFSLDARKGGDLAPWTDLRAGRVRIEIFARAPVSLKGKEKALLEHDEHDAEWFVLETYDIDLADLVLLPDDVRPATLPANTLTITLSPPGKTYYCMSSVGGPAVLNRIVPSPLPELDGYATDPEAIKVSSPVTPHILPAPVPRRRRHRYNHGELEDGHRRANGQSDTTDDSRDGDNDSENYATTSTWHDMLNLATLHSCIRDNEVSLKEITSNIDRMLQSGLSDRRRAMSERQCRVDELRVAIASIRQKSNELRQDIDARREQLRQRRQILAEAYEQDAAELRTQDETESVVAEERTCLTALRARFAPTRIALISTVASIFPIELRSPPDLLYTILDVPLPIPTSPKDPAPPLSLPAHRDVNEETVATALGYAAQVVHLIAQYLGPGGGPALVYPITCVGSRSLVYDGISAMVGPRMFPLYSRGVDAYRFEYGVFLLNKDIELLMTDRDLRALDIRHTLPNLKNLLLILTNGEAARLNIPRTNTIDSFDLVSPRSSVVDIPVRTTTSPIDDAATEVGTATPKAKSHVPNAINGVASPNIQVGVDNTDGDGGDGTKTPTTRAASAEVSSWNWSTAFAGARSSSRSHTASNVSGPVRGSSTTNAADMPGSAASPLPSALPSSFSTTPSDSTSSHSKPAPTKTFSSFLGNPFASLLRSQTRGTSTASVETMGDDQVRTGGGDDGGPEEHDCGGNMEGSTTSDRALGRGGTTDSSHGHVNDIRDDADEDSCSSEEVDADDDEGDRCTLRAVPTDCVDADMANDDAATCDATTTEANTSCTIPVHTQLATAMTTTATVPLVNGTKPASPTDRDEKKYDLARLPGSGVVHLDVYALPVDSTVS
ncbi:hypothetical protein FISHEDRAFT_76767 [Fistulina hepatica ATCC 64428]|uniref:Autophagy-related protein 14 n=1 Tax=Fistulina hepatica ATCC 64428 TaxID=1128425 RepID=A0A0D7A5T3_9AGAR|nr:hypothetical protein FISHEDRAFT_76767 [Fistulina hepatica ATCC 64428]